MRSGVRRSAEAKTGRNDHIVDEALEPRDPFAAPTRRDLQRLSRIHLREAKLLLRHHLYHGAYYLAGLSVECAIKACIARKIQAQRLFPLPSVVRTTYSHDLAGLLGVAGLGKAFQEARKRDEALEHNWRVVNLWQNRYDGRYYAEGELEAPELIRAVADRSYGVLAWVRQYW